MLNDFYHMLNPVAISAGPITIYWYGLAYVVGALLTAVVMYRTEHDECSSFSLIISAEEIIE